MNLTGSVANSPAGTHDFFGPDGARHHGRGGWEDCKQRAAAWASAAREPEGGIRVWKVLRQREQLDRRDQVLEGFPAQVPANQA